MIAKLLIASALVATTVTIHASGLGAGLSYALRSIERLEARFWQITWLLIRIAWWLIVLHLLEIAVWALFFWWHKCLPDVESSFYFSGVTYATIVRTAGGIDWHSHVRTFDGIFLRRDEQNVEGTHGNPPKLIR
jgi:hypothetical protein